MQFDKIKIEILDDGRLKINTDDLNGPNHKAADELLDYLARLMGGEVLKGKRKHNFSHQHQGMRYHSNQ